VRADVVVIGAGQGGLTAAAYLAKAGKRVVVCERAGRAGGLAAAEEFVPGYTTAGVWHQTGGVRPWAIRELDLERHGLIWSESPAPVFLPEREGRGILLTADPAAAREEIAAAAPEDTAAYAVHRSYLKDLRGAIGPLLDAAAPDVLAIAKGTARPPLRSALALRRMGRQTLYETLRIPPMCAADWVGDRFETELLRAGLALPGVAFGFTGPWSPGTAGSLLHHELQARAHVSGGPAAVIAALERACAAREVSVRTGAAVRRIVVRGGAARGVELEDGETVEAGAVLSTADPRTTLLRLVHPRDLPYRLQHRIRHFRGPGSAAVVRLALREPLRWNGRPDLRVAHARVVSTVDAMERAFDPGKYGRFAEEPVLDVFVPTVEDPGLATAGGEVVTLHVHTAPYALRGGWTDAARERVGRIAVDTLAGVTLGLQEAVAGSEVLTPVDLEARYGTTEGHLLHGDHALDQLLIRPTPECAGYATPVPGLWLGGSGCHPGGGLTLASGVLAARAVVSADRS
jgi:phytoene dehydrogenase-like protein